MLKNLIISFLCLLTLACQKSQEGSYDRFPEGKTKENITLEGIDLKDNDLQLTLFASEPDLFNPTNMDIDHKGRIWICEAYNYRNDVNNVPYNKKGDKILILEDTNADGKSDKTKVFYQGEDINSALGITVLGNKTIVSCSPNVFVFTDENGDDIPDKKEILFKTIAGLQSDHGVHSCVFGPDGKLYFNFGNFGEGLLDKNNQPIKDIYGRLIGQTKAPFQDGMALRCDIDGKNFEVLAWNFRNNYELCIDSYGRIWQSDNDDDGKKANRINYVMPGGNYGYKDEMTGADWRVNRTNLEDSVFNQHWHQNDPGVIPNLKVTGYGSPTGIFIYEGSLLPEKYRNGLFLADAGTNDVSSYERINDGAGYIIKQNLILDATKKDMWFRPSDICTAPDGSVFVADWYDSGVGGHFIGDLEKGRIYRLSSNKTDYKIPTYDFKSVSSCVEALQNPSNSVRYLAYSALTKMSKNAESELVKLSKSTNPVFQARAYWLLSKLDEKYVLEASKNTNEQIRAAAVRMAKRENNSSFFTQMATDDSFQVKQAVGSAIYKTDNQLSWMNLANSYKPGDKWFLESIGIGADGQWDKYLEAFLKGKNWINDESAKDIIWRSRSKKTSAYLAKIISNLHIKETYRYFRAFDFQDTTYKNQALLGLLKNSKSEELSLLIFKHFDAKTIVKDTEFNSILPKVLENIKNDVDFIDIVSKYGLQNQRTRLEKIVLESTKPDVYEKAALVLSQLFGVAPLKEAISQKPLNEDKAIKAIQRLGLVDNETISKQLILIFSNKKYPFKIREAAILAMEGYQSDVKLWNLVKINKVPKELIPAAKVVFTKTFHSDLKVQFEQKFGKPQEHQLAIKANFLNKNGDAVKGKELFGMYCTTCHVVNGNGMDFGPALSQIGKKLTKESIYNAIVNPSQGVSFGYEGYNISLTDGSAFQGIITSKTNDEYLVKMPGQSQIVAYKKNQVKSATKMETSLMPAFPLKETEYLDLIGYLEGLK
jgi:putative membrane-bound dehydrogenase-like protein